MDAYGDVAYVYNNFIIAIMKVITDNVLSKHGFKGHYLRPEY